MYFDRWDIIQAHYWYCTDYHTGMGSELYERLCRISEYYQPGASEEGPTTENAQAIYDQLSAGAQ